jgi:hypothetical protein
MALKDELGKGKKALDENIKGFQDLSTQAQETFTSIIQKLQEYQKELKDTNGLTEEQVADNKDIIVSLTTQLEVNKELKNLAKDLAGFSSKELSDKKKSEKVLKNREKIESNVVKLQAQSRINQERINQATKAGNAELLESLLKNQREIENSTAAAGDLLDKFKEVKDVTEKINKETGFVDRLAKGIKSIPGLGPLFAKPLEDASSAYRKMRLEEGASKMDAMLEGAKGLADSLGPAAVLGLLFKANQTTTNLARNLQISKDEAIGLKSEFNAIALNSGKAYLNQRNLAEATGQLVEHLGVARGLTHDIVQNQTFLTKQMGLSAQEAGEFNSLVMVTGEDVEKTKIDIANQVKLLEKETGIQLKLNKVVADVAKAHAGLKAAYGFEIKEIAKQVVLTKELGLEVEQTAKMASQLLDFESSIAKELEAELLTGKDLNLEQARYLALQGKSTEAAAELAKQVGGTAELSRMNVLQQEALAEAMGMERNELIQSVQKREVLARLGVQNIEQLAEAGELERLKGDAMGEQLLKQYEQESAAEKFQAAVIKIQETLGNMLEGPLGGILDSFASILSSSMGLKIIMGSIIGLSFTRVISSILSMAASLASAGVASMSLASALTLGIGIAAIVAGIGVAMATMESASDRATAKAKQSANVNDFSMIGGKQNLNFQEGGLTLEANRKDMFVMGGTNLLNGNNNNVASERMVSALEKSNQIQEKILAKDTSPKVEITGVSDIAFEQKRLNKLSTYTTNVAPSPT